MTSLTTLGSTPDYTMGYSEEYIGFISQGDMEETVEFLQPYLSPGLRLLDMGCGPGHISMHLAQTVRPGEMHGIDMEPSQVEMSRKLAAELGVDNAKFQVADAARLPFEDGFFDVVNCCDILSYIPDTSAVLSEVRRVLKPGGVVHCREMIIDACFVHPSNAALQRGWEMFADLLQSDDGHPQMGREIYALLGAAGFTDLRASMTIQTYAGDIDVERFYDLVASWFLSAEMTNAAKGYGTATEDELGRLSEAMTVWKEQPGALAGIAFGRAVGVRP